MRPKSNESAGGEPRHLLIIDDDPDFSEGLCNLLTLHGYCIVQYKGAPDEPRDLEHLKADVALIDIRLGHQNGISLMSVIRRSRPDILCLMMTAFASVDTAVEALHEGAYDYLRKPFHADELIATLDRCFERIKLVREKQAVEADLRTRNLQLEQINERLHRVVQGMQSLTTCTTLDELCRRTLEEIAGCMSVAGGSVYLKDGDTLVLRHAVDPGHAAPTISLPAEKDSVFDRVLRTGQSLLVTDVGKEGSPKLSGWDEYTGRSLLSFPILGDDNNTPMGIFALHSRRNGPFTPQDRELGQILCSFFGEALQVTRALVDLADSREQFRDFAQSASDWFWELDREMRFSWISGPGQRLPGGSGDRSSDRSAWNGAGNDLDGGDWLRSCRELRARMPFRDFLYSYQDTSGQPHHIDVSGKPMFDSDGVFEGYRGIATDQTAKVEAESERRLVEARFRGIVENSPAAIVLQDLDGRILLANRRFEEAFGFSAAEATGTMARDILPPDYADVYAAMDQEVMESALVAERELTLPFADGGSHDIVVTKFPVLGADGRPKGVGAVLTDISDRKRTEEQLRQSQKMETLGQLTGGVAHDFNNLLAIVIGNLDLIGESATGDERVSELIIDAQDAAVRGADLAHRLLAFGRRQTLHPQLVEPGDLIDGLSKLVRRTLGERIEISTALNDPLWSIMVDVNQLENSILNLCINARDAMVSGGRLTIEATNAMLNEDDGAQLKEVSPRPYLRLDVVDNGVGMPPEVVKHATEPFFTTKEVGQGSGLGLSMVYGFVRQSGGHLKIESKAGSGTTVSIYLPKADEHFAQQTGSVDRMIDLMGNGQSVLVVEDEPGVRKLTSEYLGRFGYRVAQAGTGQEALLLLDDMPDIDLLFTDIALPGGMTGIELARQATSVVPGLKVLYTSGYADGTSEAEGSSHRAQAFINKPFRKEDLARKVQETLAGIES